MKCDVRNRDSVDHFILEAKQRLGGVHFLVNNAGIASDGALWRLSEDAWNEVLETNATGAFNCIRSVAPIFRGQHFGKIVSVSAHQAERPGFGRPTMRRARPLASRAPPPSSSAREANVNAVAPGFIWSLRMATLPAEVIERAQKSSVLGRVADPDDVAHVISFLCSESAWHITGQTIVVDGIAGVGRRQSVSHSLPPLLSRRAPHPPRHNRARAPVRAPPSAGQQVPPPPPVPTHLARRPRA